MYYRYRDRGITYYGVHYIEFFSLPVLHYIIMHKSYITALDGIVTDGIVTDAISFVCIREASSKKHSHYEHR